MKQAATAASRLIARIAAAIGLEGAFFFAGTTLLSVGASLIHPAGPALVWGGAFVLIAIALTIPDKEP